MKSLAASALSVATLAVTAAFSPSTNPCVKRVGASRFRFDPYCSRVVTTSFVCTPIISDTHTPPKASAVPTATPMAPATPAPVLVVAAPPQLSVPPQIVSNIRYAVIKYKVQTQTFIAPFKIAVGDKVVVEGDRGENIGIVQEITQVKPSFEVSSKILRRANEKDLTALAIQREKEAAALKATQDLAGSLSLHCIVEDTEYQFDMNKLTVYVRRATKNTFVDFRKLQRGLFREFRCRIWCAYMDEVEAAEQGLRSH